MEKERPSHKWGAKKAFSSEVFDSIIAEFKEGLKNAHCKEKNKKTFKQKGKKPNWRSKSNRFLENFVIWNQKYSDNPLLDLTFFLVFASRFTLFVCSFL